MDIKEQLIEHFAEIFKYTDPKKVKEVIKDNLGRFYQYEDTTEFLKQNQLEQVDKLSKKEKNILADTLVDNPCAQFIVKQYNSQIADWHTELKDKTALFKSIKTISEFLKVSPYKEDRSFQQSIYSSLVSFHFNEEKENQKLLQKSFNLFLDKNTIKGFLGKDSLLKKDCTKQIQQKIKIDDLENRKSTLLFSISGLVTLGVLSKTGEIGEQIDKFAPKISVLTHHIHNLATANTVSDLAVMGIMGYFAYEGFKKSIEVFKKISENSREERIGFTKTEDMAQNKEIGHRLLNDIIYNNNKVDAQNQDNKNYFDLCLYLQEKLNKPNNKCYLPKEIKTNLNLSDLQVKNLEKLSTDDIHEIANIANPQARVALLLNTYSSHEKSVLKQIVNAKKLFEIDKGKINYFSQSEIKDQGNYLESQIKQLNNKDKALVSQYLELFINKEGFLNHTVKTELEYALKNKQNLVDVISNQLDIKIANKLKEPEKNEALGYFKRAGAWITGTTNDQIISFNSSVANYIKQKEQDFGFTELSKNLPQHETWKEKVDNKGSNLVRKIGNIRDKIFGLTTDNQQRPTI